MATKSDVFRQRSPHALAVLALREPRIKVVECGSPVGSEAYGLIRGSRAHVRISYTGTLGGAYALRSIQSGDTLAIVSRTDDAASVAVMLAGDEESDEPRRG